MRNHVNCAMYQTGKVNTKYYVICMINYIYFEFKRCKINNPCDQQCFDTGVAVRCSCDRGYKLNPDKVICKGNT